MKKKSILDLLVGGGSGQPAEGVGDWARPAFQGFVSLPGLRKPARVPSCAGAAEECAVF